MKFGLACEGPTDQIVLRDILCGYFNNPDLDDEIIELQPRLDKTEQEQNFGGWEKLLDYLKDSRFAEDVLSNDYVVLQLDTDISEHRNFNVSQSEINKLLTIEKFISIIIGKLILTINENNQGFYEAYSNKLIFAICVHSLECWLYAYYNTKPLKNPKITGCGKALNYLLKVNYFDGDTKDKKRYSEYSKVFLKRKNIDIAVEKDQSFKHFIQQLELISP
jgi:hypothetical protein